METQSSVVLLTGANGFVGRHLATYLLNLGLTVIGVGRQDSSPVQHQRYLYRRCDLAEPASVRGLIRKDSPSVVIHLAATNQVQVSWQAPAEVIRSNALTTLNLLESIRGQSQGVNGILLASSLHEYDLVRAAGTSITEDHFTRPRSPYGWSKVLQTSIGQMYAQLYGLPIVVVRSSNLIGPGTQGVCADLARQVVTVERGTLPGVVYVGDPTIQRDFLDVRDAVQAYWQLLQAPWKPGEVFNVCRGHSHAIAKVLWVYQKHAYRNFVTTVDAARIYTDEPGSVRCDAHKIHERTGWKPRITLEDSLVDLLREVRQTT
jgi:GDP-4-dehydro-6-deoxy-D-mannose reductase